MAFPLEVSMVSGDNKDKRRVHPPTSRILPTFDPGPSGDFACRVMHETCTKMAVIGRLAIWAWVDDESEHEFTKDLDMAVSGQDRQIVTRWLEKQGLRTRTLSIGGVNVYYPESRINVDFIDRTNEAYGNLGGLFSDAIKEASARGYTVPIGSAVLPLAPVEHVVVMKLVTGEDKDERDAERLLLHVEGLDVDEVRLLINRFAGGLMGRLDAVLRRIGHPDARKAKTYNV